MLLAVVFSGGPIIFKPSPNDNALFISVMVYSTIAFVFIPFYLYLLGKCLRSTLVDL